MGRVGGLFGEYFYPVFFGTVSVGCFCLANYVNRKPMFTGVHRHMLIGIAAVSFGVWLENKSRTAAAERDAIMHHYMSLHPEDFEEPPRKKYGDVLQKWYPIR